MVSSKNIRGIRSIEWFQIMILEVCQHFTLESTLPLFTGHEVDVRPAVVEDDCSTQLTKRVTDIDFTLWSWTMAKNKKNTR